MNLHTQLEINGYVFFPKWMPETSTINIAKLCGEIFSFSTVLGYQTIPDTQQLKPKEKDYQCNTYSGHFGLDNFPLHTDLAHWHTPPRYLMLRCIQGSKSVKTHILPFNNILDNLQKLSANKAIFSTRPNPNGTTILLPMTFHSDKTIIAYRWDSIFLLPVNSAAKDIQNYFKSMNFKDQIQDFELLHAGDTLIIDNFKNLHGRSEVVHLESTRIIERIYLNKVY
ncbi:hypothetical protein [Acinetobacter sp. WCHA39]|jgi:alpha-ketoglutarate-dependent taurine dioxygenase|uniref:hypothetical protein n=1 Tax=Acinetobacter sp. WCHA39 TaxID=2004648 RepID=UPI000B3C0DBD|nr:hypothetical protein [Acinetobacter sp. WCHA39]